MRANHIRDTTYALPVMCTDVARFPAMPRKQRFKPSRKPKPAPQAETQAIGHEARNPASHGPGHGDNPDVPAGPSRMSDESSSLKNETDPR